MTPSATHPDESLIEYCRDGVLNADGDVCCAGFCDFCGEEALENSDGSCSVDLIQVYLARSPCISLDLPISPSASSR